MKLSKDGTLLIHNFEDCKLVAYPDPKTGGDPWTIGRGHTGKDVHKGLVWTLAQCDDAFDIEYYTREGTLLWNYDNPCNMVW